MALSDEGHPETVRTRRVSGVPTTKGEPTLCPQPRGAPAASLREVLARESLRFSQ